MTRPADGIRPISADSHIVEPPNCFVDYIEPSYRERAPRLVDLATLGLEAERAESDTDARV